jgi:hypothetical protein
MRHPKILALASASVLACLTPLACAGPETEETPALKKATSPVEGDDNGTRLTASQVGAARCDDAGNPSVTLSGLVTTTGSVDSVELVASVDGAEDVLVGEIAPQAFIHRGRFKDAPFSVSVPVPAGQHEVTLCFVQSGAQGREEKQACSAPVAIDVTACQPAADGGSGGPGGGGGPTDGGSGPVEPQDELPPVSVLGAVPLANGAGWNNTDVAVRLTATDDKSGVKEIHWVLVGAESAQGVTAGDVANLSLSAEGSTTITYFAVDNAGNVESPHVAVINIDKTAPVIGFSAQSPAANGAGWNNTGVAVPFVVTDALSGVASFIPGSPLVFASEGAAQSAVVSAVDVAGNVASATSPQVHIDLTAPVIDFGAQSPAANGAGWNNTGVAIPYATADALSGVASASPGSPVLFDGEGAAQSAVVTVVDVAGNVASAASPAVNIDMTPPVITFGAQSPAPNAAGWNNTDVSIPYTVADVLSGVAGASPGSPVVFTAEGSGLTQTVTAVDFAGNVSSATSPAVFIDKTPPVIGGLPADGCTLWPPNHKMWKVADVSAQDGMSGYDPSSWNIQGVSNEPDDELGDGKTTGDIRINGTVVELRAERSGRNTGRIYTVTAQVRDAAGNTATRQAICTVPHDQRGR